MRAPPACAASSAPCGTRPGRPYTARVTWPQRSDPSPVAAHCGPGEQVLWTGRPAAWRVFQPADWFLIPFSLIWGGFAFAWEGMVVFGGAPLLMALFGVPFVLVGLYLMAGRFAYRAWANRRTWYGLTDRRAVVVFGTKEQHVRSVSLDRVSDLTVSRRPDGSGTLVFGQAELTAAWLSVAPSQLAALPGWSALQNGPVAFVGIPEVSAVEALVNSFAHDLR